MLMTQPLAHPSRPQPLGGLRQGCWRAPQLKCTRLPSLPGCTCAWESGDGQSPRFVPCQHVCSMFSNANMVISYLVKQPCLRALGHLMKLSPSQWGANERCLWHTCAFKITWTTASGHVSSCLSDCFPGLSLASI